MRLCSILLVCLACLSRVDAQVAGADNDEAAVRAVVKRYVDAREQREEKAVAALFTSNADQLVSTGEWRKGRDELVRGMLASSGRNSGKRTIAVDSVRFIAPGIAIADGRYEIGGSEARKMWTTFVMKHSPDGWRIEAIRNMMPSPSQ
jgi:uncharacterized protein (TIGR02246 family)